MNVNQLSGLLRSGFFFLGFCPQTALSFRDALKQSFGRLLSSCFLACPGYAARVVLQVGIFCVKPDGKWPDLGQLRGHVLFSIRPTAVVANPVPPINVRGKRRIFQFGPLAGARHWMRRWNIFRPNSS